MPRVLGFDPGLHRTGYAVLEGSARQPSIVEAGVLRISASGTMAKRLDTLHREAVSVISDLAPDVVAIEELFSHYDRPKTAILMGHARGVLFLAAAQAKLEVFSYLPTKVKKSLTGSGHASKEQMQRAIQLQFDLVEPPDPPDIADAIAISLCHFLAIRLAG